MGDYRVTLGVDFTGQSVLNNVQNQINTLTNSSKKVKLQIDTSSISNQINNIQNQLKNVGNIKVNIGNNSSSSGINQLYNSLNKLTSINLQTTYQQISNMERALDNFGFDKSSIQNVVKDLVNMDVEISRITTNMQRNGAVRINVQGTDSIGRTVNSVREVMQVAGEGSLRFETQIRDLGTTISQTFQTSADKAKQELTTINTAYNEVISTIQKMGSIQVKLSGLDPQKDANQISILTSQLTDLQTKYTNLRSTFDSKFDTGQLVGLHEALKNISNDLSIANGKMADKSAIQQQKSEIEQTKLEIQETTQAYNELLKIQNQIGSVKLSLTGLDPTKNANEISALSQQLLKLKTEYDNLYLSFERRFSTQQLDGLTNSLDNINAKVTTLNAKNVDNNAVQQQVNAYKELLSITKQMGNIELKITGLKSVDGNTNQIKELENQYKQLEITYKQLESTLNTPLSYNQTQGILTQIGETHNKLALLDSKIADTKQKLANGITVKFNNGNFDKEISSLETKYNSLHVESDKVTTSLKETKNALQAMNNAIRTGDVDNLVSSYKSYENALQRTSNEVTILSNRQKELVQSQQLAQKANNLSLKMDNWLKNNSAAASQFGARIRELQTQLQSCDSVKFNNINNEFNGIIEKAKLAGVNVQTFGDRLKTQLSQFGIYMSGAMAFTQGMRAFRSMANNVLEVDTAMTELYRITDLSSTQYANMYDDMVSSAKEYGNTLDNIINSTADWVRLGFDPSDAVGLSEITTMYQHVTDLDSSTAVDNLVTAYKGFEQQLLELNNDDKIQSINLIADIYDKLGKHKLPLKNYIG